MGTTVVLAKSARMLGQAARGLPSARTLELRELTSYAERLRSEVEERWGELPQDLRRSRSWPVPGRADPLLEASGARRWTSGRA